MKYTFNRRAWATAVHNARWGRGMTFAEFAAELGVTHMKIFYWEHKKYMPKIEDFIHACTLLELNPDDFLEVDRDD